MKKLVLEFNESPPLINQLYAKHHYSRHAIKKKWHLLTIESLRKHKNPPKFTRFKAIFERGYWCHPADLDGLGVSAKAMFDALRKQGIIPDDNPNYFIEYIVKQKKYKRVDLKTTLTLIEV